MGEKGDAGRMGGRKGEAGTKCRESFEVRAAASKKRSGKFFCISRLLCRGGNTAGDDDDDATVGTL